MEDPQAQSTSAAPQATAQTVPVTPPTQTPVSADGGELGRAAIGALQGATEAHAAANTPTPPDLSEFGALPPAAHKIAPPDLSEFGALPPMHLTVGESYSTPSVWDTIKQVPIDVRDLAGGALKSVVPIAEEGANLMAIAYEKMRGKGQSIGLSDVLHPPAERLADAEPSTMRNIGEVGGNVVQFILGDEALKTLSLADRLGIAAKITKVIGESPFATKALDIGMTALRQSTVSGAQTLAQGGTASEAAKTAGITGLTSGVVGGLAAGGSAVYKSLIGSSPEAMAAANQEAAAQGSKLADEIAGKPLGGPKASALEIEGRLDDAENQMHAEYSQGLAYLSKEAGDVSIPTVGTKLQELVKEMNDVGDLSPKQEAVLQIDKIIKGEPFAWGDMIGLRKNISAITRRLPYDSPLLRDLGAMRYALDDTTQSALDTAEKPELAKTFSDMRKTYFTKSEAFRDKAVRALTGSSPDDLAKAVIQGGSKIQSLESLRTLVGTDAMAPVEGRILKTFIDEASQSADGFNPRTFVRSFNKLNPDVKQAIWGKNLPQVQDFLETVQDLKGSSIGWNMLAHYIEHRATYDVVLGSGLGVGLFWGDAEKGRALATNGAILGALLMLHSPTALNVAKSILTGAVNAAVPITAAVQQPPAEPQPNEPQSPQ